MNLLLVHQYFLEENDPGGSRWNEMTKVWVAEGHSVTVLAGMIHANGSEKRKEYKGKYFVIKKQGDITVIRCHVSEAYNKNFLGRLWGYFSFMFSSLWAGVFKAKSKFDLVIVTSPPLFVGFSGYVISKLKRIPFVFEIRDLWPESAIDTGVLKNKFIINAAFRFEKFIYKKASLINVLTPAFRDALIEKKNVPPSKIIFIPNAADFTLSDHLLSTFDRNEFRKQHDLDDYFVIIYVGAHGVANHLQQILEAGKKLEDTNVLFLLIGQGMEKERLMSLAKEKEIKNVRFLEPVSKKEIFEYILASDLGMSVLKKVDTFKTVYSNKTFDYMACKKPILMAIDGVSRTLVEEARAGTYVEPENAQSFNDVIRLYLNNEERILEEGKNGYMYAKDKFDRHKLASEYLEHLKLLVQK